MKFLPNLIITCAMAAMAFELAPLYEGMVSGLFEPISHALILTDKRFGPSLPIPAALLQNHAA